jgi:hypothetical protein
MIKENWIDEIMTQDLAEDLLKREFESPDTDDPAEHIRCYRLDAINDYAKFYDLTDVVERVRIAQENDEDIYPILAMIGFTFDGKRLHKIDDKIISVPFDDKKTDRSSKPVLTEGKDEEPS